MTTLTFKKSYDEIGNIRTFVFDGDGTTWQPGQYRMYELANIDGNDDQKQRFFTIASAPSEHEIHITTRVSDSQFKQTLNALQPGDQIEAGDAEGDFVWDDEGSSVLVAGGIGVTPYRSMLLERAQSGKVLNTHLLYYGRDDNFAFKELFDRLVREHPELKIDYIIGENISADTILAHAPEAASATVYVSGPEPMVEAIGEQLSAKGITLKQDWFPGYTNETY